NGYYGWTQWTSLGGGIADADRLFIPPVASKPSTPSPAPSPDCTQSADNRQDPYTGQSWSSVWTCSNAPNAKIYAKPNFESQIGYMSTTPSWFVCYAHGNKHAGGNDIWYYTLGDGFSTLEARAPYILPDGTAQPWGYMPAV